MHSSTIVIGSFLEVNIRLIVSSTTLMIDYLVFIDINLVTIPFKDDKLPNGDNNYTGDYYHKSQQQVHRSAKKPAPPVPKNARPLERSDSINGSKYSSDSSEDYLTIKESTSLESDSKVNLCESDPNSPNISSVIYTTASLDRPLKRSTEGHIERPIASDRNKLSTTIQMRNKVIEKPNVPPPSVPTRNSTENRTERPSERPHSIHERPTIPPPERPQRSCDNKAKPRSVEALDDSDLSEDKTEDNSKPLYPSLNELIDGSDLNELIVDYESNDNSSLDSFKQNPVNDCIAFADDSDVEDNNNVSNKYKMDSTYVQRLKQNMQHIPSKPPRSQSPAANPTLGDRKELNTTSQDTQTNSLVNRSVDAIQTSNDSFPPTPPRPLPPRPLPPSKPRIATSSENTHL